MTCARAATRRSSSGRRSSTRRRHDAAARRRLRRYSDGRRARGGRDRAHLARRTTSGRPHAGGLARRHARTSLDADSLDWHLRAQGSGVVADHVRPCRPRSRASSASSSARRPNGSAAVAAAAALLGIEEVWAHRRGAGHRGHGLRHRVHRGRSTRSSARAAARSTPRNCS